MDQLARGNTNQNGHPVNHGPPDYLSAFGFRIFDRIGTALSAPVRSCESQDGADSEASCFRWAPPLKARSGSELQRRERTYHQSGPENPERDTLAILLVARLPGAGASAIRRERVPAPDVE